MRTIYHEFESLDHLLATRLLPGGGDRPIRFVLFGGTGAVGGATVLELCRLILASPRYRHSPLRGQIYATGFSDKEVVQFVSRLYLSLEGEAEIEKVEPKRHYRIGGQIDIHFSLFRLALPHDLRQRVLAARDEAGEGFEPEKVLSEYFAAQPKPFLRFIEELGVSSEEPDLLLHAVLVAIPLPSVAAYTLDVVDGLTEELGLDHRAVQRIKADYLKSFIRGLAVIQQRHARHVLMAHTTAVGGMYRVDGGTAEIRIGFAHSALGKKLVDKKFFADELTQLYIDHGFYVLVTAAAIGIDAVDFHTRLPLDRGARRALGQTVEAHPEASPIPATDLDDGWIRLYPSREVDFEPAEPTEARPLDFGEGKDFIAESAIRSGENGIFTVANSIALYNVMKVAIPEELALVLVRFALFGPERRRDWFDGKICYYAETENSQFALRMLESYPQLVRSHYGAFAVQSYQALGSATHQARVHELGLVMLLLRLRELGRNFEAIPEEELEHGMTDLDDFLWKKTRIPTYEDFAALGVPRLAELLGRLCEVGSMEDAGHLLGFDVRAQGLREAGRERFLARLATRIGRYVQTITSLGSPILYQSPRSGVRLLVGPYVAPFDQAPADTHGVMETFRRVAEDYGVAYEPARDWLIVNNGFIDFRPHVLANRAKEPGPHLVDDVRRFEEADQLAEWLESLELGSYFTTCGLAALEYRLRRLYEKVQKRQIRLGTRETWKHLFPQDAEGRHPISPGLIETVRMYSEGLGKVTGTEALWPGWGY